MEAETTVNAGICGFSCQIKATCEDMQFVTFEVKSDCESIQQLAQELQKIGSIDSYREISPRDESKIFRTGEKILQGGCRGCIVPVALFKTMQVAAGLALPMKIDADIQKNGAN